MDDAGHFAVNGQFVATLDLSARDTAGDVAVGAGYYAEDKLPGETAAYADFEVWSLDAAGKDVSLTPAPGAGMIAWDEGWLVFDLFGAGDRYFGVVSLTAGGEQTEVEIAAFDADGSEIVAIHPGPCGNLDPYPDFPLAPIDPGSRTSATTVSAPFEMLTTSGYAVVVFLPDAVSTILACTAIPAPAP